MVWVCHAGERCAQSGCVRVLVDLCGHNLKDSKFLMVPGQGSQYVGT